MGRVFVCDFASPEETPNPGCPNAGQHEPWPTGYVATSVKADEFLETYDQHDCAGCGQPLIWTPKEAP